MIRECFMNYGKLSQFRNGREKRHETIQKYQGFGQLFCKKSEMFSISNQLRTILAISCEVYSTVRVSDSLRRCFNYRFPVSSQRIYALRLM